MNPKIFVSFAERGLKRNITKQHNLVVVLDVDDDYEHDVNGKRSALQICKGKYPSNPFHFFFDSSFTHAHTCILDHILQIILQI